MLLLPCISSGGRPTDWEIGSKKEESWTFAIQIVLFVPGAAVHNELG